LDDFAGHISQFWLVKPKSATLDALFEAMQRAA